MQTHTRQDVGESVLAHVGRLDGGDHRARFGVVRTQRVPFLLQPVLVRQVILHVRLSTPRTHTVSTHASKLHISHTVLKILSIKFPKMEIFADLNFVFLDRKFPTKIFFCNNFLTAQNLGIKGQFSSAIPATTPH